MAVGTDNVQADASTLVAYAVAREIVEAQDEDWAYNRVLELVGQTGPAPLRDESGAIVAAVDVTSADFSIDALLNRLAGVAVANGLIADSSMNRDHVAMNLMGTLMARPSDVTHEFHAREQTSGVVAATDWFYRLCCDVNYVRREAIARNVEWVTPTRWGDLELTINLSKPEKDPRDIARAGAASKVTAGASGALGKYPACALCMENEGYSGRGADAAFGAHPARQNLRIVPVTLGGERWGMQYSPYAYFNEHCIVMSREHRLMHVDRANMARLFDFVERFPHYFIGSNADLPIVGGSILSHDHFQGGRHVFPMMDAGVAESFSMAGYPHVRCEVIEWPLSVLRLTSSSDGREELLDACQHVLEVWRDWEDASVGIVAHTAGKGGGDVRHNTVTPVARLLPDGSYQMFLALRCNIATDEHPLGVFHPHAEWHHIKKENIGLIEVMGRAILPARLVTELGAVEGHLLEHRADPAAARTALEADPLSESHAEWALELLANHPDLSESNVHDIVLEGVGQVFGHVLEDAGVYKWDEAGRLAQGRFLAAL
jgi:UDPglucose--hexose-1-phosphate uridylyltransferase